MHIIFLKFGPNRAQAGQWMAEHKRWMQQGIDDGSFLMTGSLDNAQGGAVLAAGMRQEGDEEPACLFGLDMGALAPCELMQHPVVK